MLEIKSVTQSPAPDNIFGTAEKFLAEKAAKCVIFTSKGNSTLLMVERKDGATGEIRLTAIPDYQGLNSLDPDIILTFDIRSDGIATEAPQGLFVNNTATNDSGLSSLLFAQPQEHQDPTIVIRCLFKSAEKGEELGQQATAEILNILATKELDFAQQRIELKRQLTKKLKHKDPEP